MRPVPKTVSRILDALRGCKRVCVVGHMRPDGDCIGSQVGLALALRDTGRKVACWNQDRVPHKLAFLVPDGLMQQPRAGCAFDAVIATDCASVERLGTLAAHIADRRVFINIDHHESNTRYADINWVSGREASTGELIFRLLKAANWPITPPIADCLFTAVSTDTGSFQYPSTRPSTYHVAAELVKRGASLARICHEVYQSFPVSRMKLLRHVFNHFRLADSDRIAWVRLRKSDYARTGADPADSEGLIDHIRDIEPVIVACVFEEAGPGLTRVSLRSKSAAVNVNEIAAPFGGGGHPAAAGARIRGNPADIQRRVLAAIKKSIAAAH
ncbi:MAG: bifunctional oligoribonuclease/PAP phosphatase NrnA [Verrucomicrobia bacterium]|nr:bifunctional oligoribonuclease/PAP phosphatase NrnA [Verrucomicrobiota bacterium]